MRTETVKIFKFDELSENAKQKAIEKLSDINTDHRWFEFTYDDAKTIGLKITEFDLDRNKHAKGQIIGTEEETARLIKREHGEKCETYILAEKFLNDLDKLEDENEIDELKESFEKDLLEEYASILQREYEYLTSEKAIIETIETNDYEFTEDGEIY